jgi:hypothetical protein
MEQVNSIVMSHHLRPRCPRDSHVMSYEPRGIRWKSGTGQTETLPSYHCDYLGCSVRYDPANGYYTVINEPDVPYFVDEPAANLVRCPLHGTWLYREVQDKTGRSLLKCGVDGCTHVQEIQYEIAR